LNSTHLLHSIFGQTLRWEEIESSTVDALCLRFDLATIIQKLFLIDSRKNSNESILRGILELYTGSRHLADRVLLDVMGTIERQCSLNMTSTSMAWNAFRKGWSLRYVDAISSSPESPSGIIIKEYMINNILNFDSRDETALSNPDQSWTLDEQRHKLSSSDPCFWLPLVAYCLELVAHSADLTVLIENYAIGYAITCLSSESETTRKMAASILLSWDHLCGVSSVSMTFH
jgi:hypothetical protein